MPGPSKQAPPSGADAPFKKRHRPGMILLVEDDPKLRKLYTDVLETTGLVVVAAKDGEDGLSLLYSHVPRLLVLDIMLPDMDGIELCRRAREILGPNVPVLFLTALDNLQVVQLCFEAGADDYLIKGEDLSVIAQRVSHWLSGDTAAKRQRNRDRARTVIRAAVAHESGNTGSGAISSETDQAVHGMSAFLAKAIAAAGDGFGETGDRMFLAGYAVGVVDYWATAHTQVMRLGPEYLKVVLRETGVFAPGEVELLCGAIPQLRGDVPFAAAIAKGTAEALAGRARGRHYTPAGLAKLRLAPPTKRLMAEMYEKLFDDDGGGPEPLSSPAGTGVGAKPGV